MSKTIPLTHGKCAIVDDADFERLSVHKWSAIKGASTKGLWYAVRSSRGGSVVYMHREIMGAQKGTEIDHADRNGLNNQRTNLRPCTRAQNCANITYATPSSGFRGVYYEKKVRKPWSAQVTVNRRTIRIGRYSTPVEAAKARDKAVRDLYGDFAVLNFPEVAA